MSRRQETGVRYRRRPRRQDDLGCGRCRRRRQRPAEGPLRDWLLFRTGRSARVIDSIGAVLRGYGIGEDEMTRAIRTIRSTMRGFAMLEVSRGFQWDADLDDRFAWMAGFVERGLRVSRAARRKATGLPDDAGADTLLTCPHR